MAKYCKSSIHPLARVVMFALTAVLVFGCAARAAASPEAPQSVQEPEERPSTDLPPFRVTSLHQWIVDWMVSVSPPGQTYVKDAEESAEDALRRYEDIADDVISVAYDERERPVFSGKYGRAMTAALMVAVAFNESSFRKDVDFGLGPKARGDSGKSWCLMQVWMGRPRRDGTTDTRVKFDGQGLRFTTGSDGWGGEDLVRDRRACFQTGIRVVRMSFNACRRLPVDERLAQYASGDGTCTAGRDSSKVRVQTAQKWLAKRRPPLTDAEAAEVLQLAPPQPLPWWGTDGVSVFPAAVTGDIAPS